ncbi:MAG: hypothetical protein F4008_12115, partial [Gammaproteobacteria bacterium]|nr:hypothetical protein [Gammaproteobacteria bacterium]
MRLEFKKKVENLFVELNPALEAARKLDREMNRVFAHRFNVLDYVHTKELGLSRIIADLFDPNASHGQGTFFIKSLLTRLKNERSCVVDEKWLDFDSKGIHVSLEKTIKANRRIDIYVTIKSKSRTTYRLAIENKPYADDQENQVADYLKHLKENEENFLFIYLSSRGQKPTQKSLPESEYPKPENQEKDEWMSPFKIMAYHNEAGIAEIESDSTETNNTRERGDDTDADDELADYRISFSLANWLSECRKNCEVDRLRSFLRDAEQFCIKRFGVCNM